LKRFAELREKKAKKAEVIESQIEECDKKIFQRRIKRSAKIYNMTQTAKVLGVHRETLYYWIKKGWVKPKRDYRNYPIFTVLDIENLIKWKKTLK
jgi:transcriptional regulator with PAS, ATPase and Fis domain